MRQPEGYAEKNKENLVCKLQKSIYGLKQASRCWFNTMHRFLKELEYRQCSSDACLYTKQVGANFVIIVLFVDDLLIASNNEQMLQKEKKLLGGIFEMKNLGEAHYILGIQIIRDRSKKCTMLHQSKYLMQLLEKFGMKDCRPVATPQDQNVKLLPNEEEPVDKAKYQALIGSITYAVTGTRPDLAQALGSLSQFCSNPGKEHWVAAKRISRYLKGSLHYGIVFDGSKQKDVTLIGYTDADWGTNPKGRKVTIWLCIFLCGGIVSWKSKKQSTVALSSTEVEYIAGNLCTQEAI